MSVQLVCSTGKMVQFFACSTGLGTPHKCILGVHKVALTNLSESVDIIGNVGKNETYIMMNDEYHIPSSTCSFYVRFLNAANIF